MMGPEAEGRLERRVLLIDRNPRHLAWLSRILRIVVSDTRELASLDQRGAGELEVDLIVANYDGLEPAEKREIVRLVGRPGGPHLLLISSWRDAYRSLWAEFEPYTLTNLLAKNETVSATELIVTVQKILRGDIFGLWKYFVWGVPAMTWRLTASADKPGVIEQVDGYARGLNVHPRLVEMFSLVADELVTNALYNAPRDRQGRPRTASLPRSEPVALEAGEDVKVTVCCDAQYLGVSITDCFGAFDHLEAIEHLARNVESGGEPSEESEKGGAGIGLYLALSQLSHFIVNVCRGERTEVIGLLDIRGGYKALASQSKSLNIFVTEPSG